MKMTTYCWRKLGLVLSLLCCCGLAQAQTWQSAMTVGNPAAYTTSVTALQTDAGGNVYILGSFTGTMALGNTTLTSVGSQDVFVAKWSPATSSFAWAVRAGGSALESPMALAVNYPAIYLTGGYGGANAVFGNTTLPNAGTTADVFVAKLTDAGSSASFSWVLTGGGTANDTGSKLAVLGNAVYVGGVYSSAAPSFGSSTLSNAGGQDAFLAKLTDNGATASFNWAQSLSYNSANTDVITALVASSAGVYMAGYYNYYYAPIGVGLVLYSNFLTKLLDNGNSASYGWQQTPPDIVSALAVNGANLYVAGIFKNVATFGTSVLTGPLYGQPSSYPREAYVAKLVDAGATSSYVWGKQTVNSDFSNSPVISSLAVRGTDVYAAGYSGVYAAGYPGSGPSILGSAALPTAYFVAKLSDAGNTVSSTWALQASGIIDVATAVLAVSGTAVYAAGTARDPASFGNIMLNTVPVNSYAPFLATIADVALPTRNAALLSDLSLYPNPAHATATVRVTASGGAATLTLLDALGRVVRTQAVAGTDALLDLAGLAPGVYALRVQTGEGQAVRQLVVE